MIVWLNGTFGAGKTTTARELAELLPGARLFDPEIVGYMLRHYITEPVHDFQDWPAWRALVPATAVQLLRHYGGPLVAPMTLLRREYAAEIFGSLAAEGVPVRHFLLHADHDELVRRIESDTVETGARQWRLDHLTPYREARPWLDAEAEVIDTTSLPPAEVAKHLATRL
ncbi:AAA family ATPase [Streptomyces sp. YIM 98790]|uniref:AAA family ATPase n=1 Tax=Streptomyces sp. YIM 98790 TaxID=2689077 RepID=UPI0014082DF5|nr:AAA family ATPase [Streptomyces sp. YIM 98790]